MMLCLLGLFLGSTHAWAQTSSGQIDAVRKRMEDGLALFVGGDPAAAAQVFEEGYQEYPYSAFLFNAGVCYQKLGKHEQALKKFQKYMQVDPEAPDIDDVRGRVARLESTLNAKQPGAAPPPPPPPPGETDSENMRSLVVVESEPAGAPVRVFRPTSSGARPFDKEGENPQWTEVVTTKTPTSLSLSVGVYHIVVDEFENYNASDTQLRVSPGHVHHFKANLSQGVFMAFLRVSSNVKGAHIWLDDREKSKPEWGTTPYGELVASGEHQVLVEAPGFQPLSTTVELQSGERKEIEVKLARVNYGFLRVDANLHVDPELGPREEIPDVYVFLDGQRKGVWRPGKEPVDVRASAGKHQLLVSADGYKDFVGQIEVPKGQVKPVHVKMIPKYPRGAAWTQTVLAAGFLGAGIYLGAESESIKEDLEQERMRGTLEADDSRIPQGRWFAVGANVGFAAGGVFAALATWNFIKDPLPDSSYKSGKNVEFEDPYRKRPTALQSPSVLPDRTRSVAERETVRDSVEWAVTPSVSGNAAAVFFGGRF